MSYKDLCAAVLLNIASFVIGDEFRDHDDDRSLKRARTEEFDSDSSVESIPEYYSDIDASSEEDARSVDVSDGYAWDCYLDRKHDRQGERHNRRERALGNLRDKEQRYRNWSQKIDMDMKKAKQDAQSIVSMMCVCKDWRKELSVGGDAYANKKLWKSLVRNLFPPEPGLGGICIDNILEKRGYSSFSIFQLMVKISLANDAISAQTASALEGVNLEEILVFVEFEFKSRYGTKYYKGFGEIGDDQILRVKIPKFGDLVENKCHKWSKDAKGCLQEEWNSRNRKYEEKWTASSEEHCKFPVANIFVIVPSKKCNTADTSIEFNVMEIYSGKPKWFHSGDCWERFGDEASEFVANLFGKNYLSACDNECVLVYEYYDCNGPYSDKQEEQILENKDEYVSEEDSFSCDETLFAKLRKEDLMDFLLGSGEQYTTDVPCFDHCNSDDDY